MDARLLLKQRHPLDKKALVELTVWEVPEPVPGSRHSYKYSFAYVASGLCLVRFDNESGKGDHCHLEDREYPVEFSSLEKLLSDFWEKVDAIHTEQEKKR